jgi:putative oxidoreductase
MKRLLSISYSQGAFNIAMLVLRVSFGVMMIPHGYDKLVKFAHMKSGFINFLGMGSTMSLALDVFAEFFCSIFLVFGLFARIVVIPLIIAMCVVVAIAHHYEIFGKGEHGAMFLAGFIVILLLGPGKISVDGVINK